jgi:hypothetical protein
MEPMEVSQLLGVQEVPSSNLGGPTKPFKHLRTSSSLPTPLLGPNPNSFANCSPVRRATHGLHCAVSLVSRDGDNAALRFYGQEEEVDLFPAPGQTVGSTLVLVGRPAREFWPKVAPAGVCAPPCLEVRNDQ